MEMRASLLVQYCLGVWSRIWGASLGTKEKSRGKWELGTKKGQGER